MSMTRDLVWQDQHKDLTWDHNCFSPITRFGSKQKAVSPIVAREGIDSVFSSTTCTDSWSLHLTWNRIHKYATNKAKEKSKQKLSVIVEKWFANNYYLKERKSKYAGSLNIILSNSKCRSLRLKQSFMQRSILHTTKRNLPCRSMC